MFEHNSKIVEIISEDLKLYLKKITNLCNHALKPLFSSQSKKVNEVNKKQRLFVINNCFYIICNWQKLAFITSQEINTTTTTITKVQFKHLHEATCL